MLFHMQIVNDDDPSIVETSVIIEKSDRPHNLSCSLRKTNARQLPTSSYKVSILNNIGVISNCSNNPLVD